MRRALVIILICWLELWFLFLCPAALRAQTYPTPGPNSPHPVSAAFSIGNSISAQAATQTSTITTSAITITAGQALIGAAQACYSSGCNSAATGSQAITDSQSDSWVCPSGAIGNYPTTGYFTIQLCYVLSAVGGSTTFTSTVTTTGTAYYPGIAVAAVNGISGGADTSAANGNQAYSASPSVTSNAVAGATEFIFGATEAQGGGTTPGQTSIITWNSGQANLQWTTGPASGTQTMTWTATSDPWVAAVMALK
jgi:hypothetical protein